MEKSSIGDGSAWAQFRRNARVAGGLQNAPMLLIIGDLKIDHLIESGVGG